jgi:hypothetical protein
VPTAFNTSNVDDVALYAQSTLWISGMGARAAQHVPGVGDGGFVAIANGTCNGQGEYTGIWSRDDGKAYLVGGGTGTVYSVTSPGAGCMTQATVAQSSNLTVITGIPHAGGTQLFVGHSSGRVSTFGDGVTLTGESGSLMAAIDDLAAVSDTSVFAVGVASGFNTHGGIAYYDGGTWTQIYSDGNSNTRIHALSFVSPTLGYAAGLANVLMRYDGTRWQQDITGPGFEVFGLKAFSSSDIYAVGADNSVWHYDGSQWTAGTRFPGSNLVLNRIRGTSACDLWVVGANGIVATTNQP